MIAVDTNILVCAHREDAQWHDIAHARLTELAEGRTPWAIPWALPARVPRHRDPSANLRAPDTARNRR
jgi:predicted nucleic acid-binding protein